MQQLIFLLAFWPAIALSEFQVQTAAPPKPADMKTNIVYYKDRTTPYAEWTGVEKSLLNLHSAYKEPDIDESHDGIRSTHHETLMMFIAKASFLIEKPADQIRLERFLDKDLIQNLDRSVDVQAINHDDVISYKQPGMAFRNPPATEPQWCDDPNRSLCLKLHFNVPKLLQPLLYTYFIAQGVKERNFDAETEVRVIDQPSRLKDKIIQLTGLPTTPTGVLTENFFWFTHVMQFAKVVCYLQPDPTNPQRTIVTGYTVFGIEQKWWNKKVGDVEASKVLMGETFLNHGDGIIQGLPGFSQHLAAAFAEELRR